MGSNHLVADCDQPPICGTCGKEHRTADCTEDEQERYWFTNCKSHGHASWDCTCPKFIENSRRLEQLNPESTYIYFPTDEPWTWEQLENPIANGWTNNVTEMRNSQIWTLTVQAIHAGESGNDRRTPMKDENTSPRHIPIDTSMTKQPPLQDRNLTEAPDMNPQKPCGKTAQEGKEE